MARIYKIFFLFLLFGLVLRPTQAQELSTLGKTFWLTFMENNASNTDSATPPEMKIVISCPKATSGTVKNVNTGHSLPFSIGSGGGVDTVFVPGYMGYCYNSEFRSKRNRGLLVEAKDTVAVSAQSTKSFTCDASLIYPIEALGVDYRIISYLGDPSGPNSNYRSAFAIVATENSTTIEITPTVNTKGGNTANTKFTIVLNKGESYQVQASTNRLDLSGTLVQALNCKKIAVFGGSSRSAIGPPGSSCASSYDHLYEQLMPINLWGKKFIIAPTVWAKGKLRKWELIKIVSNTNNTVVRFNNRPVKIINAGFSDTFWIDSSRCKNTLITANKAVGVCQYASSEACDGGGFFGAGTDTDPMMMWVAPIEQSLKSLNFSCENALTINKFFLNVYVKTAYRNSFRLDGSTPTVPWQLVNNDTSYSYIQQSGLTQGKHNITSPYGFSAMLYAYGDHGSYGYNAGSSVKALSFYMTAAGKSSSDFELDTPYYIACQGTSIPFDVATSYTPTGYKWILYNPSGNVTKTSKAYSYTFTDTGMIKVMAVTTRPLVGVCNGISTDTLINFVKVFPKPKIRLLADTTICKGNSFYITSKTDGDTNYTFTPSTWLSCNKCFKPKCTPLMDTSYTVVATTKGCTPSRDTFKVKLRDSLILVSKSNDTTICRGTSTTLTVTAKGGYVAGQTITWDNGLGTGFSKVVAPKVTTTYRLILNDGCTRDSNGNLFADTSFIKVTVHDSLKITMPRDTNICEGTSVTLTAKIVGGRPGTSVIKWDNGLDTGNNKVITIGSVGKTYKAVLSDGCTVPKDSGYVKITVRPGLKIDTILYQTPVCRNTPFKVSLKLSGGDSTGYRVRLLNSTYSSPGQVIDSFKNTAYPYFNIQIPDDSKFKIAFDQACNSNNTPLKPFNVAIKNTLNIVSTLPIDSVCKGQSYDIKATGSNSDNIPIKFILKRKNGASYTPIDSMIHLSNASFTLTPPITPSDYIIIGNDGCNRNDTDKFRVAIKNTLNIVSTLPVDTVCTGQSYDIKASGKNSDNIPIKFILKKKNGSSYTPVDSMTDLSNATFKVTPTITQTDYIIIGNDGCNLNDTDKFKLMMRAPMTFKTNLAPAEICRNESYTFTTSVNDGKSQSRTYTWTDGRNGTLLGTGNSVTVTPTASMVVAVTADDACSSPIIDSTYLYVAPVVSNSSLATDTAGCEPYSTVFKFPLTVAQSINTKFNWVWYFDNNAPFSTTPSSGGQTHADITKSYTSAGIFNGKVELVLSNGKICYSFNQNIDVWKQANADFIYSPIQIDIIEPLVTFTNKSTGATNYTWDFGDNSALDYQDNPTHNYTDTGTFQVKLTATNVNGCNDFVTYKLTVLDIFRIWIPTAFSPNLDEFNSYWTPNVTSMQKMEFEIFNRWGEQVFKSDGSLKWTGQYTNKPDQPCPEGIYYYHIKVRDNRKHWHYYNGTITLLR